MSLLRNCICSTVLAGLRGQHRARGEERHLRRGARRDGGGEEHRYLLTVRTPLGPLHGTRQHRLPAKRKDPGTQQAGQDCGNILQVRTTTCTLAWVKICLKPKD